MEAGPLWDLPWVLSRFAMFRNSDFGACFVSFFKRWSGHASHEKTSPSNPLELRPMRTPMACLRKAGRGREDRCQLSALQRGHRYSIGDQNRSDATGICRSGGRGQSAGLHRVLSGSNAGGPTLAVGERPRPQIVVYAASKNLQSVLPDLWGSVSIFLSLFAPRERGFDLGAVQGSGHGERHAASKEFVVSGNLHAFES